MGILIIIQVILSILIFFNSFKIYKDYCKDLKGNIVFIKEDRMRFPIIFYALFIIFTFIPIIGLFLDIILIGVFVFHLCYNDIYYKSGSITKFLFKKV